MKLLNTLCFTVVLVSSIFLCSSFGSETCDAFVDDVLKQLKEERDFFQDPYDIPTEDASFGIYEVLSGEIYGLNTLHRINVLPLKNPSLKNPYLRVYLGVGELKLKCSFKRKFLDFGKSANVEANIPFVSVELKIVPKPDGSEPEIKDFKIDEVKGMNLKVTGTGFIKKFFLNAFIRTFGRFFKQLVRKVVENGLRKFLQHKVKEFTIPTECLDEAFD